MSLDAEYVALKQGESVELDEASFDLEMTRPPTTRSTCQAFLAGLIFASLLGSTFSYILLSGTATTEVQKLYLPASAVRFGGNVTNVFDYVKGPPSFSLRDNLRPEYKYVTGWDSAGMTNIVMSYVNLIYVAKLADRIPIIPPFTPHGGHLGKDGNQYSNPMLNFGEIFDLPRLRQDLNMPILEWKDVKVGAYGLPYSHETTPVEGAVVDKIGCWAQRGINQQGSPPVRSLMEALLQLDVSFTTMQDSALIRPPDYHVKAWSLVEAMFSSGRNRILSQNPIKHIAPTSHEWLPPDDHLACFDEFYNVAALTGYEWFYDYVPMWRFIGKYLRFNQKVDRIADQYLMKLFDVDTYSKVPPFIAIHIRRGDWDAFCFRDHPDVECWAPMPTWENHVKMVQQQLKDKFGENSAYGRTTHVIVTSDEKNSTWWDTEVTARGWLHVDFKAMDTIHVYNRWYPSVIDSVIQSRAIGLVGLQRSTMSQVAKYRVEDWNGGVTSFVRWDIGKGGRRRGVPSDYD